MKALLTNRAARSVATVVAIFLFYLTSMLFFLLYRYEGNYSTFLHISAGMLEKNPLTQNVDVNRKLKILDDTGYDGQIFYFMAYDPLLTVLRDPEYYRDVVDLPVFRYRRIGFSLFTHVFSLGNPNLYPVTMMWMILASHAIGAFFLVKIAIAYGRDPLWALLYILIPGYALSLMYALPESIAGALLLAGFYFTIKNRTFAAIACFAFSLLFRETGILFIGIIGLFQAFNERDRRRAILIWCSAIPYFAWRLYVTWKLSPDWGWSGFFLEPENLTVPFTGILELFTHIAQGNYPGFLTYAGIVYPLLLLGAAIIAVLALRIQRTPQAFGLLCYSLLALCLNFQKVWIHVANAERQTFESFLCLLLVFLSTPWNAIAANAARSTAFLKKGFAVYFVALFFYDFLISVADVSFRAAFYLAREII
jgi:hypothetical protein